MFKIQGSIFKKKTCILNVINRLLINALNFAMTNKWLTIDHTSLKITPLYFHQS